MFPREKRAATLFHFRHNIPTHFCEPIAKTPCPSLTLHSCPARLQRTPTPDRYQGRMFGSTLTYRICLNVLTRVYGCFCRTSAGPLLASEARAAPELALAPHPEVEEAKAIQRRGTDSRGDGKGKEEGVLFL